MRETPEQRAQRHKNTAESFRLWLAANPNASRREKVQAFDKIADSFAPHEVAA